MITSTELSAWSESVRAAEEVARENAAGRDDRIRWALAQGMTLPEVAKATGLTRARIYQIRDVATGI